MTSDFNFSTVPANQTNLPDYHNHAEYKTFENMINENSFFVVDGKRVVGMLELVEGFNFYFDDWSRPILKITKKMWSRTDAEAFLSHCIAFGKQHHVQGVQVDFHRDQRFIIPHLSKIGFIERDDSTYMRLTLTDEHLRANLPPRFNLVKQPRLNRTSISNYLQTIIPYYKGTIDPRIRVFEHWDRFSQDLLWELFGNHQLELLIASIGNESVGVLEYALHDQNSAELTGIAVNESWRGQGYGKILLLHLLHLLRRQEVTHVTLRVYTNSTPALELYQKVGFEKMAQVITYCLPI